MINYASLAGIIFGGAIISTVLQNAGGIMGGLAMLKFSRGAEVEADNLGVQYLYASGYDPTAMSTMFEKLASKNKKKRGSVAKLFSSHPQSIECRETSDRLVSRRSIDCGCDEKSFATEPRFFLFLEASFSNIVDIAVGS